MPDREYYNGLILDYAAVATKINGDDINVGMKVIDIITDGVYKLPYLRKDLGLPNTQHNFLLISLNYSEVTELFKLLKRPAPQKSQTYDLAWRYIDKYTGRILPEDDTRIGLVILSDNPEDYKGLAKYTVKQIQLYFGSGDIIPTTKVLTFEADAFVMKSLLDLLSSGWKNKLLRLFRFRSNSILEDLSKKLESRGYIKRIRD